MDKAVHALVEKVNSQEILVYQEKTQEESNNSVSSKKKMDMKIIHNFTINLILEEKMPIIFSKV